MKAVRILVSRQANVNAEDDKGITPLLLAGCYGNKQVFEEIVKILVDNGADVNKKNDVTGA